ncbi:MAG: hypothetical protein WCX64_01760 [Candidatus Micrarchaeia archaeon]
MEEAVKIRSLAQELGATGVNILFRPKAVSDSPSSREFGLDYLTPVAYHKYSFNTPKEAGDFQFKLKKDFKIKPFSYAESDEQVHSVLSGPKTVEVHNQDVALDTKTKSKLAGAVVKIRMADVAKAVSSRLPGSGKRDCGVKFSVRNGRFSTPWSLYGPNPNGIYKTMNRIVGERFSEMVVAHNRKAKK